MQRPGKIRPCVQLVHNYTKHSSKITIFTIMIFRCTVILLNTKRYLAKKHVIPAPNTVFFNTTMYFHKAKTPDI